MVHKFRTDETHILATYDFFLHASVTHSIESDGSLSIIKNRDNDINIEMTDCSRSILLVTISDI